MVHDNDTSPNNKQQIKRAQAKQRKPSKWRFVWKTLGWLTLLGFAACLFVGGAVFGYVSSIVQDEPIRSRAEIEAKINHNEMTGFTYFRDGTLIGQLRSEEDRRPVTYEEIPSIVIDAVIAIEDNNFDKHFGIDFKGTMRAVKQRVLNEDIQTGGSTLTQQLARRVFLNLDKTANRKVKEILLALRLERFLTKPEILTAYLNKVPFGNGSNGYQVYGIKAAAKGIFNITNLNDLNIAQAAYLAGLPQLPSSYSAFNGKGEFNEEAFKRAIKRQQLVLARMLEENKITAAEYEEAMAFDIKASLAPQTKKAYETYPYLMMETERQAAAVIATLNNPDLTRDEVLNNAQLLEEGRQQLLTGGYRVYTTIDKDIYKAMHKVSENPDNFSPDSETKGMEQVASIMIDNKTGAILGMIEGRDFYTEQMNYATQMKRQPGSTMKPIAAYLPAMEAGLIQPASIIDDSPVILKDGSKGYHIPVNASGGYKGLVTARTALSESRNIPALKIYNDIVGIEKAWDFAKTLGITTLEEQDYSAQTGVLGGLKYGVTVEELTNAYSAIANKGQFNDAYMIQKITDFNGEVIYKHQLEPKQVFSPQTAYLMTDMLRSVITSGTGTSLKRDFKKYGEIPIVGKTGSTQNYADVWFMGYTPDISLGVWVGYKEQIHTLSNAGKSRARSIWAKVMNEVTEVKPDLFVTKKFEQPEGIVKKTVSGYSGKLPTELTKQAGKYVTDIFNAKYVPTEPDDVLIRAKYIPYEGVNYIPHDSTPADMILEKVVVKREKPIKQLIEELEKAFAVMKGPRRSISYYIPKDAGEDAPYKQDPRVDDGADPAPPANVSLTSAGDTAQITFSKNSEKDVVGYRLYRSIDNGPYKATGKVVLTGQETVFTDSVSSGVATYYVTAVDVAGRESQPSITVSFNTWDGLIPPSLGEPNMDEPNWDDDLSSEEPVPPSPPTQVNVSFQDGMYSVTWSANSSSEQITGYNIYLSDAAEGNFSKLGSTPTTQFSFSFDSPSGWVRVSAVNTLGESSYSAAVQFHRP